MANVINATSTGNGGLITTGDDSGILNIQTNETTAVSVDASQNLTFTNAINAPNTFGFKNRLINGGMTVAQRGTSGTVGTGSAVWMLDRWQHRPSSSVGGTTTWSQVFDSTTGNTKLRLAYSSATSSAYFQQKIEAQNVTDLWGSSLTLSFYASVSTVTVDVYSYDASGTEATLQNNVTPTSLGNSKYQLTFTCTTPAGGIRTGTELSLLIVIKPNGNSIPANSTNYDYWNIQLEKGTQATSFDFRNYGMELAMCQRYCIKGLYGNFAGYQSGTTNLEATISTPVPMRATPSVSGTTTVFAWLYNSLQLQSGIAPTVGSATSYGLNLTFGGFTGFTNGYLASGNMGSGLTFSAEL